MTIQLEQVEFANEAFYLAFESKDIYAINHLWSEQVSPICLHPGWPALVGREAVLDSFKNILSNPEQGQVSFFQPEIIQVSETSAVVVCYEQAGSTTMVATNTFVLEEDRVRLCCHQAGFCARPPEP